MNWIEKLFCGSVKEAAIFLATLVLFYCLIILILMDFNDESFFLLSERKEDLATSVIFYSTVVFAILMIPTAISFLYGVMKKKPSFMIPILFLLPFGPLMRIIYLVLWFDQGAIMRLFISLMIIPYAWVGFYMQVQDTRREKNKNLWVMYRRL